MAIPILDIGALTQPVARSQFDLGSVLQAVHMRQQRKQAAAELEQHKADREALNQRMLAAHQLEAQMSAERLAAQQRIAQNKLAVEQQHYADAQKLQQQERQDKGFANLYGAIGKHDPALVDAYLQDLQRQGLQVEHAAPDPQLQLQATEVPTQAPPVPAAAPAPKTAKPMTPKEKALSQKLLAFEGSTLSQLNRGGYAPLPDEGSTGMAKPRPARALPGGSPFDILPLAPAQGGPLPPAKTEADLAQPRLPAARTEVPFRGVRVRDKAGNLLFTYDPETGNTTQRKAILDAIGVTQQAARDPEEVRASNMGVATTTAFLTAHPENPDKAYQEGRRAYEKELARLGRKRQFGKGAPATEGLTGKEHDKRATQIQQFLQQNENVNAIKDLNKAIADASMVSSNLDAKSGFAHLNGLVHAIKTAQGGRVSDADKKQADESFGKVEQAKMVLSRWTGQGQMPPAVRAAIREAEQATLKDAVVHKQEIAKKMGELATRHPDWRFKDEADKAAVQRFITDAISGGNPAEKPAAPAATAAPSPTVAPKKRPASAKDLADKLLEKM